LSRTQGRKSQHACSVQSHRKHAILWALGRRLSELTWGGALIVAQRSTALAF
jgi:hypothetical protein